MDKSPMHVLLIGSGGREHALAWKLKQSPRIGKLYIAPGNGGTERLGENVPIVATDIEKLAAFASEKKIALTIVGPDDPLALGVVDLFRARKLRIFGPTKAAARIESSKSFAKKLMQDAKIPTAQFKAFDSHTTALAYVHAHGVPVVIKASGLSLGKGVYICKTMEEAESSLKAVMVDMVHGEAGREVVIEDFLEGPEVSVHVLSDALNQLVFPSSQDHKPALDGDEGNMTGGMGTIAPVPFVSTELMGTIERSVVRPALDAMLKSGAQFEGLLYPGLKITNDGPKVLEFNARFGDPETQVYMRLLKSDLLDLLEACVDHTLGNLLSKVEWVRGFAANIVLASGGYPDSYKKGFPITGIDEAEAMEGIVVFHAGTAFKDGSLVTNGGRVLGVSALGGTPKDAIDKAYAAVQKIHFEGMHYRKDIGAKAASFYDSVRI
ncbi:MAG TPA: phosphoribosylamine--glycine ligase [Candidatus Paceibacterota bacterium]|nr:phosphoribosylamine--glycine ligase [Candidatus Paceibacterota bacterium]